MFPLEWFMGLGSIHGPDPYRETDVMPVKNYWKHNYAS